MEEVKIPARSEWNNLTILQLYEVKQQMTDRYFNMRSISATFAPQYLKFIGEIDALIKRKEREVEQEREAQG